MRFEIIAQLTDVQHSWCYDELPTQPPMSLERLVEMLEVPLPLLQAHLEQSHKQCHGKGSQVCYLPSLRWHTACRSFAELLHAQIRSLKNCAHEVSHHICIYLSPRSSLDMQHICSALPRSVYHRQRFEAISRYWMSAQAAVKLS